MNTFGMKPATTILSAALLLAANIANAGARDELNAFTKGLKGLAQMEYVDALGQRTRISFTGWKRNPVFARGTFVYVPQKGVDVIGG